MKILFITHCTGMAGANRSMLQLIIELRQNYGIEPFVLVPNDEDLSHSTIVDYLKEECIQYECCPILFFKLPHADAAYKKYFYRRYCQLPEYCEHLKEMHFDIIHSNSSTIDLGGVLSVLLGVPHVWHLREFGDKDYDLHSVWGWVYERVTYKNSSAFVAISKAVSNHYRRKLTASKLHVIYNGIEKPTNRFLSEHNNDCVRFICVGTISPPKNQIEILKAVDILVNRRLFTNFHVSFVGIIDEEYINELNQYIISHSLSKYVSINSEAQFISPILHTMDAGIMCSKNEAFGRVTVEYMLHNLAVIANNTGANEEIIQDGETGLIYKCGQVDMLANQMQRLISNRDLLLQLSEQGRLCAEDMFLSKYNTLNIFQIYQNVLRNPCKSKKWTLWLLNIWMRSLLIINKVV